MEYEEFLALAKKYIQNRIWVGEDSFNTYKNCVETYKKDHLDVIEQYGLTDSELYVMFMMVTKNYSEIQKQFFLPFSTNAFTKECTSLFDAFLNKIPQSRNAVFYRVDEYQQIGNLDKQPFLYCNHYLTASTSPSIFAMRPNGIKFIINKRLIGNSKAHEVFKIYNALNEYQVNFERNRKFRIDNVDKKDKSVYLTEL